MDNFLYRLVGSLGALVGTIFLIDTSKQPIWISGLLILVVLYATGYLIVDTIRAFNATPQAFDRTTEKGKAKIAEYLVQQLKSAGSVVIFSKDLTWVKPNSEAEKLLKAKAKDGELTLYVEKHLPITAKLKDEGAEIRFYNRPGFNPTSRFTILDHRAGKTRVMIGIPSGKKHLIKHYGEEDAEVVDLAKDFISLLNSTAKVVK